MIELKGLQGKTMLVDGNCVKIIKQGLFTKREKIFPIKNITSIEIKEPGFFAGFIQLSIAGGKINDSSYKLTDGAFDATNDENSMIFNNKFQYEIALKIKEYVENFSDNVIKNSISPADEILKLKKLFDDGVIDEQEFKTLKNKLI